MFNFQKFPKMALFISKHSSSSLSFKATSVIRDSPMFPCSGPALKDTTAPRELPCLNSTHAPQAPSTRDSLHTALLTACHVLLDSTVLLWDCQSQQVRVVSYFFQFCIHLQLILYVLFRILTFLHIYTYQCSFCLVFKFCLKLYF